ncbi:hypothetical protein ABID22_000111 [Pontibacter aydingkolensis]|uniref:Uncharacterized protein n=1 Tax=Pontibacter aydingkolensis TaxID=1911536 RepID=A0ABS7CQX8_9BACT|nr:hypothetical protein [Pontibacter aydingkolensis]MBW7466219.1 hypothetical protein [Pontibacter aydingkolensis]
MKVQLEIDGKLREFTIEPSEDFELPEETLKEIETELLITEAKALSKQLKLNTPDMGPKSEEDNK